MAKLRKGRAYTNIKQPYTRKSKYRSMSYVRSSPVCKVTRFDSGAVNVELPTRVFLRCTEPVQMRHNCIESARMTVQRALEKKIPKEEYHFKIKIYPHHHLRENPLASGAGADRMSTGMQKSFGKVIGLAAQVRKNQEVMEVTTKPQHIAAAKEALRRGNCKLPRKCIILSD